MYDDDSNIRSVAKVMAGVAFVVLGIFALVVLAYALNLWNLRFDTAQQPARRNNINNQAENQIANNAHLWQLLGDINTDRSAFGTDRSALVNFEQLHPPKTLDCQSVQDYNDCQQLQNLEANVSSDDTTLRQAVNQYNSFYADSDNKPGLDTKLPHHVKSDGSYKYG